MAQYHFDSRVNGELLVDEIGADLPSLAHAKAEAAVLLLSLARDTSLRVGGHTLEIVVRDSDGFLFRTVLVFN